MSLESLSVETESMSNIKDGFIDFVAGSLGKNILNINSCIIL